MPERKQNDTCLLHGAAGFEPSACLLGGGGCNGAAGCDKLCGFTMPQILKGELIMKIVVVDNPKFWSFFLRRMFGIKKVSDSAGQITAVR